MRPAGTGNYVPKDIETLHSYLVPPYLGTAEPQGGIRSPTVRRRAVGGTP